MSTSESLSVSEMAASLGTSRGVVHYYILRLRIDPVRVVAGARLYAPQDVDRIREAVKSAPADGKRRGRPRITAPAATVAAAV